MGKGSSRLLFSGPARAPAHAKVLSVSAASVIAGPRFLALQLELAIPEQHSRQLLREIGFKLE
jgi:hypothetical protein